MNSPDVDELLSTYIDGLASADEARRIESDPALLARADELRAAARVVAAPVTPARPADVDAAIASVLEQSATAPNVTALGTRARSRRRVVPFAAAAAVVALWPRPHVSLSGWIWHLASTGCRAVNGPGPSRHSS